MDFHIKPCLMPEWTDDESSEIARRRYVLGPVVSEMLTDVQILQIQDPGPTLHSPAEQAAIAARLRLLSQAMSIEPSEDTVPQIQDRAPPKRPEWTAAERIEIARRRYVLGEEASAMLSDEQMLQIQDPGPERKSPTEQAEIAGRLRVLGAALSVQRSKERSLDRGGEKYSAAEVLEMWNATEREVPRAAAAPGSVPALSDERDPIPEGPGDAAAAAGEEPLQSKAARKTAANRRKKAKKKAKKAAQQLLTNAGEATPEPEPEPEPDANDALVAAVQRADVAAVRQLLANNAKPDRKLDMVLDSLDMRFDDGRTLLMRAIQQYVCPNTQHSTAQHSTAQHSTAQRSAAQRSAAQRRFDATLARPFLVFWVGKISQGLVLPRHSQDSTDSIYRRQNGGGWNANRPSPQRGISLEGVCGVVTALLEHGNPHLCQAQTG
jgi:hypothetical protein